MDDSLAHSPHGSVDGSHPEVAVLVDEGNRCGGYETEGERNHDAHNEDHHTVKSSKFVSPQRGESYQSSYHVNDSAGEDTPDKHTQPERNRVISSDGDGGTLNMFLPHLVEILNTNGGIKAKNCADREICHLIHPLRCLNIF